MCGRLTLTTEVSSTSSTALDITAMATIQRCTFGAAGDAEDSGSEYKATGIAGSAPVPEAENRLETDILSPRPRFPGSNAHDNRTRACLELCGSIEDGQPMCCSSLQSGTQLRIAWIGAVRCMTGGRIVVRSAE